MDPVKVTYKGKSFSVDSVKLGMVTLKEMQAAEGQVFADFLRKVEAHALYAMGIPREVLEGMSRRERQLREIMGDEFVEDNAHAPGAYLYWRLIAAQ